MNLDYFTDQLVKLLYITHLWIIHIHFLVLQCWYGLLTKFFHSSAQKPFSPKRSLINYIFIYKRFIIKLKEKVNQTKNRADFYLQYTFTIPEFNKFFEHFYKEKFSESQFCSHHKQQGFIQGGDFQVVYENKL